jgi:hypothetical protein
MTAVTFHDLPHAGQAGAGAGEVAGRMQPLERLKQLARIGRIEAGAVVAHVVAHGGVSTRRRPELDRRVVPA